MSIPKGKYLSQPNSVRSFILTTDQIKTRIKSINLTTEEDLAPDNDIKQRNKT